MPHTLLTVKNATLKMAPTRTAPVYVEFGDALSSAKVLFTSTDNTWEPISGNVQNSTGALKYEVVLDLGQDTKSGGLLQFLVANHGAAGKMEFYPKGGTAPKVLADVIVRAPGELGGAVGVATTSVTLKVDGAAAITWD